MSDKDITPRNAKGQPHGLWDVFWMEGKIEYKCVYHNGEAIGYEEHYEYNGNLIKFYHL